MKEVLSKENIKLYRMCCLIDDDQCIWSDKEIEEYHIRLRKEYYVRCISVFDRWLSDEEYDELMIYYQRKFNSKENKEKYYQYEQLFIKFLLILALLFFNLISYANPKPIGLELNKATLEEVKEKYKVISKEANKWNGTNYYIDPKSIDFKNVSDALIICNDNNIVQAVILVMSKNNFNELFGMLSEKYTLKEKNIPFVGNKKAIFVDDDCTITLDSPHLNFDMELMYITNEFYNKYLDKLQQKEQLEKEKKKNLL